MYWCVTPESLGSGLFEGFQIETELRGITGIMYNIYDTGPFTTCSYLCTVSDLDLTWRHRSDNIHVCIYWPYISMYDTGLFQISICGYLYILKGRTCAYIQYAAGVDSSCFVSFSDLERTKEIRGGSFLKKIWIPTSRPWLTTPPIIQGISAKSEIKNRNSRNQIGGTIVFVQSENCVRHILTSRNPA